MEDEIKFELLGIAEMIKRHVLIVPSNQREYSWHQDIQVKSFMQDISNSMAQNSQSYFLGTVVLTKKKNDVLEVADGQQRLATTAMVLAAIRDYFTEIGDARSSHSIETEFLCTYDREKEEDISKLTLNIDDNDFFVNTVVSRKHHRKPTSIQRRSHKLISEAFTYIKEHIKTLEENYGTANMKSQLNTLIKFLQTKAKVVKLVVPNEETAFTLFETLNDRGLQISQVDLVKNHIFKLSGDRLSEAQRSWSSMRGAIETISDFDDDITIEFLRSCCCIITGLTTKKEILKKIQEKTNNKTDAVHYLTVFEELSKDYAAILNPDHQKWNEYSEEIRDAITTMNLLGVTAVRPLMLAISKYFNKREAAASFKKIVSWSVRFLILGIRGGRLDEGYARLAHKVFKKEIKSSDELKADAEKLVVSDAEFKAEFEIFSVSVAKLARYYLRSLESTAIGVPNAEFVPNSKTVINLEHILPQSLNENWSHIDQNDVAPYLNRLGNLALLQATKNNIVGNDSFLKKLEVYKKSSFLLTNQLGEVQKWDIEEIDNRQKVLANFAVKTWPL